MYKRFEAFLFVDYPLHVSVSYVFANIRQQTFPIAEG